MTHTDGEFSFIADEKAAGQRIDAFLAAELPGCSRSHLAQLLRKGAITVFRQPVKPGYRLRTGDEILGEIPPPEPVEARPEPIPLDILYQDSHLIVLNKPAGMVIHPAPGHASGTLVNALLHHCPDLAGIGGAIRPGIVHRLDKDTTGILLAAKNQDAQASLASQFKSRSIQKTYLAIVHGRMKSGFGSIALPIGRHPVDRKKMSTVSRSGRAAETRWRCLESFQDASLVEVDLLTGRTHQIRVHFAAVHHPIVGDPVYGWKNPSALPPDLRRMTGAVSRQMLHAWQIRFAHPGNGAEMHFTAPLPSDMEGLLIALR